MDSQVKFNTQSSQIDSICVEDIGNCALEAVDSLGRFFYLIIKTVAGRTQIISFGPVIPDLILLPKGYHCDYDTTKYTDTKIQKLIQKWALGGKGINFVSIDQIELEDAISQERLATGQLQIGGEDDGD